MFGLNMYITMSRLLYTFILIKSFYVESFSERLHQYVPICRANMNLAIVIDPCIAMCSQQDQNSPGLIPSRNYGFHWSWPQGPESGGRAKLELKSFVSSSLRQEARLDSGPVWATIGDPFKNKVQQQQP